MITLEKIKIFDRYNGDSDGWARSGSQSEKSIIADKDWYEMDSFIQDLYLVKKGLTSPSFNDALNLKLIERCANEKTIDQLKKLANKNNPKT